MGCPKVIGSFPFRFSIFGAGDMWQQLGPVFGITGGSELSFATTVERVSGNAAVIPGVELISAVESAPDAFTSATGSTSTAVGTVHTTTSLSGTTDKFLARVGMVGKLSGGSTPGYIEGTLSVILATCAVPLPSRTVLVPPGLTATVPVFFPLGRTPASGANKLRATFVMNSVADLAYLFWVRGVNDPDAPAAWVALNAGTYTNFDPTSGNVAICVADLSLSGVTPANYQFLDFMVSFRMKSGGTMATGMGTVAAAVSFT